MNSRTVYTTGLPDCPKIGQNVSNLSALEITCPLWKLLVRFLNHEIGQADLILIILRLHIRLSFAKQCCKDFTVEEDMLRCFRANVFLREI